MKRTLQILSRSGQGPIIWLIRGQCRGQAGQVTKASIRVKAPAKINLNLSILGKRADSYHQLETVMQSLALCDLIDLELRASEDKSLKDSQIKLISNYQIPQGPEADLAFKAANLFLESLGVKANLTIGVKKEIPMAAGLAGGSSDAAAVLRGLSLLFNNPLSRSCFTPTKSSPEKGKVDLSFLHNLAEQLGADVPFCLKQGTALCQGKGEIIHELGDFSGHPLLVYKPPQSVSTADLFQQLGAGPYRPDESPANHKKDQYQRLLTRGLTAMDREMVNDFAPFLLKIHPDLKEALKKLSLSGAGFVRFTGSGPSIFAIYESFVKRDQALKELKNSLSGQLYPTYTSNPTTYDLDE